MKIALITFHHVINYGSALQSYATQTILERLGAQVDVIDYVNNVNRDDLLLKNRANESRFGSIPVVRELYMAFMAYDIQHMTDVFSKYWKERLHLTERFFSCEEIEKGLSKQYDAYCTGSDQVWNTHVSPNSQGVDPAFYLEFAPKGAYCFSYAASFGMKSVKEEEGRSIQEKLKKYRHISVRETAGLEILRKLGYSDAKLVLDPTFLLKKEEWCQLEQPIKTPEHYILTYQLHKNPAMKQYIKRMSQKTGLPVVNISFSWRGYLQSRYAAYGIRPEQFVYLFDHADYVITDSFHATCFSVIFKKPFVSIYSDPFNNRMESILTLTGLNQRHLKDYDDENCLTAPVKFEQAEKVIQMERMASIQWLKMVIGEIEK